MKSAACFVGGAALVALVLAFLVAGSTGATAGLGPCSVGGGAPTHLSIQAAVSDTNCDPINVGAGIFTENVNVPAGRTVTVQGKGPGQTIVDGNDSGSVFAIEAGATATLTGLTIQNGSALYGGGIHNSGALQLIQSTLSGNKADTDGGGIYNVATGNVTVTQSVFSGNTATNYAGGGIWSEGTLQVIDSTFNGNSANTYGGGIVNVGTLMVVGSTVNLNSADTGGGLTNYAGTLEVTQSTLMSNTVDTDGGGIWNQSTLTVTRSTFSGNSATNYDGGAIFNTHLGTASVSHSTLSDNWTKSSGGGIRNWGTLHVSHSTLEDNEATGSLPAGIGGGIGNNGTLTLSASTLRGNAADTDGGGIWNEGTLTVTLSTLSGNTATNYDGGGIFNYGTAAVTHSTFFSNLANIDGGGIQNWATLTVKNSIIANSPNGGDCGLGAVASLGYNIDSDGSCNLNATGDLPNATDPKLGPLQDNGGPTRTHALLPGSPALDKGSCPGATADQRGNPRPVDLLTIANADDGCDIGAYVYQDVAISGLSASNDGPTISGKVTKLTASVTAGTHVRFTWDFGDGQSGSGRVVYHTYSGPGTYTAKVTARNSSGSATKTTSVTVAELISGLTASNDGPTVLGQPTKLTATVSAGTGVSYAWEFGDGHSESGRVVNHTYSQPGSYTAKVTATNAVDSATATTVVTVSESNVFLPSVLHKVGGCFAGPSEAELNDSSSQANGPLCPGVQITGSAATGAEDWDVFTFDLPGSATVTVDVLDYLMDAQVFLWYQSTANLVDSDRPDRVDDDYQVQHTNTSGGGRYIVGLFAPGTHPPDTQPYRLTVHSP